MGEVYFTRFLFIADRVEVGQGFVSEVLCYKVIDNYLDIQNLAWEKLTTSVDEIPAGNRYAIMNLRPLITYMDSSEIKHVLELDEVLAIYKRYKDNKQKDSGTSKQIR